MPVVLRKFDAPSESNEDASASEEEEEEESPPPSLRDSEEEDEDDVDQDEEDEEEKVEDDKSDGDASSEADNGAEEGADEEEKDQEEEEKEGDEIYAGTNLEHRKRFGEKHRCPRCRWLRGGLREQAMLEFTFCDEDGTTGCWVEEVCSPHHPWGLGCKLCRWHKPKSRNPWVLGTIHRTRPSDIKRHATFKAHTEALAALREKCPESGGVTPERIDVPSCRHFFIAYDLAKRGKAFSSFPAECKVAERAGGPIFATRRGYEVAERMTDALAHVLLEDTKVILEKCTHIALTKDSRGKMVVLRARCAMGKGMPKNFVSAAAFGEACPLLLRL